jgi:prevent-host-death family protein
LAKNLGAAEAKARFSELMARVGYGGERFIIERRGKPVAALVSVEDIGRLEEERGDASVRSPRGALALVGVWGDIVEDEEIDTMLEDIYAARERDTGRPVDIEA